MSKIALRVAPEPSSTTDGPDGLSPADGQPALAMPAVASIAAGAALVALALAAVAFFLHAQQALTGNLWGVPVDDAYIHFRFVRNLAAGHGFAFNPDQPVPASTSPLWVLLLAIPTFCGAPVWLAAKVCGVLFLALSAVLAWRLATRHLSNPVAAWTVGALTVLDGRLLWAAPSGMEVTLFTALSLAAFLARPSRGAGAPAAWRRVLLVAALCGLATLARPEGYLLTLVLLADVVLRRRPRPATILLALALYLALVTPYAAFALATTGHPLPTTFYAKSMSLGAATLPRALAYLAALAYVLVRANPIMILAPLGALTLLRNKAGSCAAASTGTARAYATLPLRGNSPYDQPGTGDRQAATASAGGPCGSGPRQRNSAEITRSGIKVDSSVYALIVWPALLIVEQAVLSPVLYHFARYVMPLQPFLLLWVVAGLAPLMRILARGGSQRAALLPLALIVVTALGLNGWARQYAQSVRDIDGMQVALGRWVRAHVPAGAPVAAHDIGAIGYISNHPVVDIEGLATPRFITLKREQPASRRTADIIAEVRRLGARYLIVFPGAYSGLIAQPGLRRVYSVTVDHPTIVQEPMMAVYRVEGRRANGER